MDLHTQIFIQWITTFMEDGIIIVGIAVSKIIHSLDFTDILAR